VIPNNPALTTDRDEPLKLPRDEPTMPYLNRHDARVYLDHCPDWYRPLAEILIGTGMRVGEAIALEWRDVDWSTPAIRVDRAVKQHSGTVGSTKGDHARTVLIAPYLVDVLRDQRARNVLSPLIVPSRAGTHLWQTSVRVHGHKATLKASGLNPNLRVHDLRHTAATLWLAAGESIYFVQQQLGHRDIRTTISQYGHPDQQAHAAAAARAADWWRSGSGTTAGTTSVLHAVNTA
jgi:integrase